MDFEQIQKKLEWLDSERRQDKDLISNLESKISDSQEQIGKLNHRIMDLEGELARFQPASDQYSVLEEKINGVQIELTRLIEQSATKSVGAREDQDNRWSQRFLELNKELEDLREELEIIPGLEEQLEARKEEEFKIRRLIAEVEDGVAQGNRDDESWRRTINLLEEGRRKDSTRLVELQAEYDNLRKRVEEQVGKVEVVSENFRKIDKRVVELRQAETQRNQEHRNLLEQQSLKSLDLERDWKKVQTNFESFMEKFAAYERKMAEISVMSQSLEVSKDNFDDNNERIEKRIHEITEMQRLNREQFLADWETFQGQDKHRWSQYMIEEEERRKDQARKAAQVAEQVNSLTDTTQNLSDDLKGLHQAVEGFWRQLIESTKGFLPKNG